ncbi:hypothetical protein DID88_006749 [Monilinia fructigena]|uniref:Uncharacterized protein n=1 Tax=Monilinia fructigena TaxID=38457 RepID=A0A395IID3_9HELO|nr:hypothetical protein DID88_006749 [Monilinia fructigena]
METRTSSLTMVGSISSVTSGSSWSGDLKSDSGDWTIFSTATWASVYFSVLSEASKSAMIASSPMQTFTIPKSSTSNPVSNPTSISTPTKSMTSEATNSPNSNSTISLTSSTSTLPLNKTWIIGPIIGSLLDTEPYMKFGGLNSPASTSSHNSYGDGYLGTGEKAQLHGDSMEMGELQGRELMAPVELPAREPVGSELLTSIGKSFRRKRKGEGSPISPSTPGGERLRDSKRDEEEETDIGMMDIPWIALQEENSNGRMEEIEDELEEVVEEVEWPLPMSPLQELFKKTEMRDGKADVDEVRHETYYHP